MARNKLSVLSCAVVLLASPGLEAAEWNIEPSIFIAGTYTDNLALLPDAIANDDLVTEVMPGLLLQGSGKRFEVDLDYRAQGLFYSDQSQLDDVLNFARADGMAKLIGESLLLDFSGRRNQQIINPDGRIGISSVSTTANRAEVSTFNVNPYWQRKLGNTSQVKIGYSYGQVDYRDLGLVDNRDRLVDSTEKGVIFSVSGNPPRSPLSWRIDARRSDIDYDTGTSVELQRVGGELAWLLGSGLTVFVGGGDENNAFSGLIGPDKIDGSFWHLGLRGKLDKLTSYEFSAGEQHFGKSFQFSLQRQASLLKTDLSYLEETTTIGRQQQGYEALFQFLTDVSGVELPTPGAEVYVRKRFALDATLELPRSRLRLNLYDENRDYLTVQFGTSDGVQGTALSWTWTARHNTELSVDAGWQRFELRNSLNEPEDVRLQLRLEQTLPGDLIINTRIWRNIRAATVASQEYAENAISIGLGKRF